MLEHFESKDACRERALRISRGVIRTSAKAIRHLHRGQMAEAEEMLAGVADELSRLHCDLGAHQDVRYAGFVDDCEQEYSEARLLQAMLRGDALPGPQELGVAPVNYLAGLGDVSGELRRHILDLLREGRVQEAEDYLQAMEDIYHLLMLFDYPDALTRGIRRKGDLARSMLEKTRGDLTGAVGRLRLERKILDLEDKLKDLAGNGQEI